VKNSGLRGRGGAGFSTGLKWSFVPKAGAETKIFVQWGRERAGTVLQRPANFRTRSADAVIEGVMIAAWPWVHDTGYIYVRGEYRYLLEIVQKGDCGCLCAGFSW